MLWTVGIGWWRLDDDEFGGEHVDGREPEGEENARDGDEDNDVAVDLLKFHRGDGHLMLELTSVACFTLGTWTVTRRRRQASSRAAAPAMASGGRFKNSELKLVQNVAKPTEYQNQIC